MGAGGTRGNLIFSLMQMCASAVSSFFLVPLLTVYLGVEGYGYVAVGIALVGIASIVSLSITSMSTRYIFLSYRRDIAEANKYFNSIFAACLTIALVLGTSFIAVAMNIEHIANIGEAYLFQVRLMILFMGGSFCASVMASPFLSGQYYTNDLRLYYSFQTAAQLVRLVVPFLLFPVIGASLWLPYLASFVVDAVAVVAYRARLRTSLPGLRVSYRCYSREKLLEVLSGGVWSSANKTGSMLISTISSYLANLLVGVFEAGLYASFAQLQSLFATFTNALVGALVPNLMDAYDRGCDALTHLSAKYIKVVSSLLGILCGVAAVYAPPFFALWIGADMENWQFLAMLMVAFLPLAYPVEVLNQVLIVQVRVKIPSIATIAFGGANLVLAVILCKCFQMGLVGIVIAQMLSQILRAWLFLPIYASHRKLAIARNYYRALAFGPAGLAIGFAVATASSAVLPTPSSWCLLILDGLTGIVLCGLVATVVSAATGRLDAAKELLMRAGRHS